MNPNLEIANEMKYLFFLENVKTTKQCCCGASLRLGTLIVIILTLIMQIGFLIYYPFSIMNKVGIIANMLYGSVQLSGTIILLIGTINVDFKLTYYGYLIFQIFQLIEIFWGAMWGIIFGMVYIPQNSPKTPLVSGHGIRLGRRMSLIILKI